MGKFFDASKYIEDEFNNIIRKVGNELADELENRLPPASKNYSRTGDVLNALRHPPKVKIKNGCLDTSILNIQLIRPVASPASYMFNHHMNWNGDTYWKNLYVPAAVPEWLDKGFTVVGKNGFRKKWRGLHYINGALNMSIDEYVNREIENSIKKYIDIINKLKG